MVSIEVSTDTLAILIAGLYCYYNDINSIAIPENIYLYVAEQLEQFLPEWNYNIISFEKWVENCLLICPKEMLNEKDIKELQQDTLYSEIQNGNVLLIVSMNIVGINAKT